MFGWIKRLFGGSAGTRDQSSRGHKQSKPDRNRARELSDEGASLTSVSMVQARAKWMQATEADPTWSVPYFNLAMSYLDGGDPIQAENYLDQAKERANAGSSSEDSQVLQQLKAIKARIALKKELKRRGR